MNVDLGLQKITSLELDKEILLLKLFDANELFDKVKTKNMLLDKVKNLELELSVAREQTNRSASSSKSLVSEIVKPVEVTPSRKTKVNLKESKPKNPTLPKDKEHDRPLQVCHFCGKTGQIRPNCFKLQATKRANKPKVHVPQAQDPMVLIGELVKVLNHYSNPVVAHHSNMNNNSNARIASKKFWMQKAQSN